jgi:hypothetical protein
MVSVAPRRVVIGRDAAGQPRTYRLVHPARQAAAYRRLAIAILGLDVPTLACELRSARRAMGQRGSTLRVVAHSDVAA